MLRVEVTDHGPGISGEFHEQIFKKFAQVGREDSERKVGTGLGLSIAKLIVQQHGGRIDFQSNPGVCTTFYIDLPRLEPDTTTLNDESNHAPAGQSLVARSS